MLEYIQVLMDIENFFTDKILAATLPLKAALFISIIYDWVSGYSWPYVNE